MVAPDRTPAAGRIVEEAKARRCGTMRPHPSRDKIVDALRANGTPLSPTQLSKTIGQSLGATAYHVQELLSAGVVELAGDGPSWGAAPHFYALVESGCQETRLTGSIGQLLVLAGATAVPAADGGYPSVAVVDAQARSELIQILKTITPKIRKLAAATTEHAGGA